MKEGSTGSACAPPRETPRGQDRERCVGDRLPGAQAGGATLQGCGMRWHQSLRSPFPICLQAQQAEHRDFWGSPLGAGL